MTTSAELLTAHPSPWPHRWAVVTVCTTIALLALGGVVTTFRVGMADPIWPTYPWHLLLISWDEPRPGFLIEHAHRLAGYLVGCCVIGLTVLLWLREPRRWLRWLGTAALLAVIVQGLLGGFRVRLHALVGTDLATVHGIFAQVVFALLVGLAVLTSRSWMQPTAAELQPSTAAGLRRWALVLVGLIFLQLVFGAVVRHTHSTLGQRLHLLTAFAVVAAVVWLAKLAAESRGADRTLSFAVKLLIGMLVVQLLLGVEAWVARFAAGPAAEWLPVTARQAAVRTAHMLLGSWILAVAVVVALRALRDAPRAVPLPISSARRLEGAA